MELFDKIIEKANEFFDSSEVYFASNKSTTISVLNDSLDKFNISDSAGLNLRGVKDGKAGYSYTEKLDEEAIDFLVQGAIDNYHLNDSEEREEIPEKGNDYLEVHTRKTILDGYSTEEKMDYLLDLSKKFADFDERMDTINLYYGEMEFQKEIKNSKGIHLKEQNEMGYLTISLIAKDGEEVKTYYGTEYIEDLPKNKDELVEKHSKKILEKLGGTSYKSGSYPVIMNGTEFIQLLDVFMTNFSADTVDKDMSLLKGKVGEKIASDKFTMVNDPTYEKGLPFSFDDEGVPTKKFNIVEEGVLKTFFYNTKMALKEGLESTGNGRRSGHKATVDIGPDTLVIPKGKKSLDELMKEVDHGIFITELSGLHAGVNAISGDFSLSSGGFVIKNGKKEKALEQITIAGNFLQMLENIVEFGNDSQCEIASAAAAYECPSVLIRNLDLAGSEE